MKVAVIIPFWNGSNWIQRAIKSAVNQTTPADELIIVDDGSKPEESEHLRRIANDFPAVKILTKNNGGQGSARNHGVANCESAFICFLDQDDYFTPDHIEILKSAVPPEPAQFGFAYGSYHTADESGIIRIANQLHRNQGQSHPRSSNPLELVSRDLYILPSASIISRDAFLSVGGFDPQFRGYEDDDLFSRIISAGYAYYYTPKPVYVWCQHKNSTSWSPTMRRSAFLYYKKIRSANLDASGRVACEKLALALLNRFGKLLFNAAATAATRDGFDHRTDPDLIAFKNYLVDVQKDNLPKKVKRKYARKLWLIEHARTFPISILTKAREINRRRIANRRIARGSQVISG